jgi:predicted transcriptional regulator
MKRKIYDEQLAPVRIDTDTKKFLDELSEAFDEPISTIVRGSLSYLRKREDPIRELTPCI